MARTGTAASARHGEMGAYDRVARAGPQGPVVARSGSARLGPAPNGGTGTGGEPNRGRFRQIGTGTKWRNRRRQRSGMDIRTASISSVFAGSSTGVDDLQWNVRPRYGVTYR